MLKKGSRWSRRRWAETRLAQDFAHRVPAHVEQVLTNAYANADQYVSNYNIRMDKVLGADGKPMFRKGLRLISHWGLRDELRALYADPKKNLAKQEMIHTIMQRIIHQQVPAVVIDNPKVAWAPVSNQVDGKKSEREADERYRHILDMYKALKLLDPYYPDAPSHIDRRFKIQREIPEAEVENMLVSVLSAPVSKQVAGLIAKRLGRKLQPFDIWYDGFKSRGAFGERDLDAKVQARFKTAAEFEKALPDTLARLGFDQKTAQFLAEHIEVDAARGAGHAMGRRCAARKPICAPGCPRAAWITRDSTSPCTNWGTTWSRCSPCTAWIPHLMEGVPNTAFTEGFAFVFQARDLDVLGLSKPDEKTKRWKPWTCSGQPGRSAAWRWWTCACGVGCTRTRTPPRPSCAKRPSRLPRTSGTPIMPTPLG